MTIKEFIKSALRKRKKTSLSPKDERKIMMKFWDLVNDEFAKCGDYELATNKIFDAIDKDFKKFFPKFADFEEEVLSLIFDNK